MKIALDYDETFTADPGLWIKFINDARERSHEVTFVTFRKEEWDNHDILADAEMLGIKIVFCGMKQKATKFNADIWIDDSPHYIPTADRLKRHCEDYDVDHQLTHPPFESHDLKPGVLYTVTWDTYGKANVLGPDGNQVPKRKLNRFGLL